MYEIKVNRVTCIYFDQISITIANIKHIVFLNQ